MPDIVEMNEALADPDFTEVTLQMEPGLPHLQPWSGLAGSSIFIFGSGDQLFEKRATEARPLRCFVDIDADLSDANRSSCIGNRG